jgi:hypothetical protein
MSVPRLILVKVNEPPCPVWVLPDPATAPVLCVALKLLDQADRALPYNRDLGMRLTREAAGLIGDDAVLMIFELQKAGKLPHCVTLAWNQFMEMAAAGDVEIATVILVRDYEYLCEDRVGEHLGRAASPPRSEPVSLADELRGMA